MVDIFWYLEKGMLDELVNFEFEEVRSVFNMPAIYINPAKGSLFVADGQALKDKYLKEVERIKTYQENDYERLIRANKKITFDQEPSYMTGINEANTKIAMINIIKKYFDKDLFIKNKDMIVRHSVEEVSEPSEDYHNFILQLNVACKRLKTFLSTVEYYIRRKHYFMSNSQVYKMCCKYTKEVNKINKSLGLEQTYHYFLGRWGRIDPKTYIDIDEDSLIEFIADNFRTNTKELTKVLSIMQEALKVHVKGEELRKKKFDKMYKDIDDYLEEQRRKGLLKVF